MRGDESYESFIYQRARLEDGESDLSEMEGAPANVRFRFRSIVRAGMLVGLITLVVAVIKVVQWSGPHGTTHPTSGSLDSQKFMAPPVTTIPAVTPVAITPAPTTPVGMATAPVATSLAPTTPAVVPVPVKCIDDPTWKDTEFGDGTSKCNSGPRGGIVANPEWCTGHGTYSTEAMWACPVACRLTTGACQPTIRTTTIGEPSTTTMLATSTLDAREKPPETCVDDPKWVDTKFGDGTSKCNSGPKGGIVANPKWCTDHGDYSREARNACPVACGLTTGACQPTTRKPSEKCVDDPTWVDTKFGDGTSKCNSGPKGGIVANPKWCTDHGHYSREARRACPVACGLTTGACQPTTRTTTIGLPGTTVTLATSPEKPGRTVISERPSSYPREQPPEKCVDDPAWRDTRYGNGATKCNSGREGGIVANPSWCKGHGYYSIEARRACPVACGVTTGACTPTTSVPSTSTAALTTRPLPPETCFDSVTWRDTKFGDGTTSCNSGPKGGIDVNPKLCRDHGNYSEEARRACPVACGVCKFRTTLVPNTTTPESTTRSGPCAEDTTEAATTTPASTTRGGPCA